MKLFTNSTEKTYTEIDELMFAITEKDNLNSFETLFHKWYPSLCNYAFQILSSKELAEEAVTEVFARLWNKRKKININSSGKNYLYTSIKMQSIDLLRKKSKNHFYSPEEIELISTLPVPDEIFDFKSLSKEIDEAITKLPEQCNRIFKLNKEDGLKYKEIAKKLNISYKTVDTQIYRAVKKIRLHLNNKGWENF